MRALIFAALALILDASGIQAAEDGLLLAPEALSLQREGKLVLIDIRTPEEWKQTGVPAGAKRADMYNRQGPAAFVEDVLAQVDGNRETPIGLICRVGNRSTKAHKLLVSKGFTNVFNIKEGMQGSEAGPGWLKRGLPLESCAKC